MAVAALAILVILPACSVPDVHVERRPKRAQAAGEGFYPKLDERDRRHIADKTYLATVHLRFQNSPVPPVNFDVRRDRRDLLSFNMVESAETSTYLHLGYTHKEGGIVGLRFSWHY